MANRIENEASFDKFLDNLQNGVPHDIRLAANKAGAKKFIATMKPMIPRRTGIKEAKHLQDSLIVVENANGSIEVGFTAKSRKGYIGRLLNDGWQPKPPHSRGKKSSYEPVTGLHFWEKTQREAAGKVGDEVFKQLEKGLKK